MSNPKNPNNDILAPDQDTWPAPDGSGFYTRDEVFSSWQGRDTQRTFVPAMNWRARVLFPPDPLLATPNTFPPRQPHHPIQSPTAPPPPVPVVAPMVLPGPSTDDGSPFGTHRANHNRTGVMPIFALEGLSRGREDRTPDRPMSGPSRNHHSQRERSPPYHRRDPYPGPSSNLPPRRDGFNNDRGFHPEPPRHPRSLHSRLSDQPRLPVFTPSAPPGTPLDPTVQPPSHFVPPPPRYDIRQIAPGADGHRVCPQPQVQDDESDVGESSGSDGERDNQKRVSREISRVNEARNRPDDHGTLPDLEPRAPLFEEAGPWRGLVILSRATGQNVDRWVRAGCHFSRRFYVETLRYYNTRLTAHRPPGVLYLFSVQQQTEAAWLMHTTGDSTPLGRRRGQHPTLNQARNTRRRRREAERREEARRGSTTAPSSAPIQDDAPVVPPSAPAVTDSDIAMSPPRAPTSSPSPPPTVMPVDPPPSGMRGHGSFLTETPVSTDDMRSADVHFAGPPSISLFDALRAYQSVHPSTWEIGVRLPNGQWPGPDTLLGTLPLASDVQAARYIHYLAPRAGHPDRDTFLSHLRLALSVGGFFGRNEMRGNWQSHHYALEFYPFIQPSIHDAMIWLEIHGLTRDTVHLLELEDFVRSWRNHYEHETRPSDARFVDPMNESFDEFPRNNLDVLNWTSESAWLSHRFGPTLMGVRTRILRSPAAMDTPTQLPAREQVQTEEEGIPLELSGEDAVMVGVNCDDDVLDFSVDPELGPGGEGVTDTGGQALPDP
ncbi:hypothetical protein FB45DRAFT_1083052 [Roridomyces roridus]|uniref:Uncharacterized protein n=1 Tax=Roridomyces roridus TaxID=1738132 RepID=A0AAD7AYF4_9AGAR|nr:hypothetical protein FB45DRAFT_1083052 [Roridomyces roridus]